MTTAYSPVRARRGAGLFSLGRAACWALFVAAVSASPSYVSAQSVRLDQYRMGQTPEDGFAVNRPNDFGHLRFGARLDVDYSLNPLVYQLQGSDPSSEVGSVVEHLLGAQLGLSFGLFDRLVITAGLPVNLLMEGQLVDGQPRADGSSLGDVYVGLRGRLFGEARDAFALSLQVTGTAPTANAARFQSRFAGEGNFTITPELLMEVRLGDVVRITGNVGARIREEQDFGSLRVGHEFTWALGVYAGVVPNVLDLSVESWGSTAFDRFGDSQVTPIEAIAGLRVTPVEGFHIGAAAGTGLVRGYGAGDFRAVLSVSYATPGEQGPGDRDSDGLNDQVDRCPDEPEDADHFQDDDGCPDTDNDEDGVPDADDGCPDQPEDRDGLADEDGCPEEDADEDGAPDETDRCPTEPGMALAARPDCTGCPTCDESRPPEPQPEPQIESSSETLPDRVYFETGDAGLRPGETAALQRVRQYLVDHPSAQVEIEGHADFRGNEPEKVALSQNRAERVAGWLERHGIDASRIVIVGCGETYPAGDNETHEGRRENRRVEFHVYAGAPSVRAGCQRIR